MAKSLPCFVLPWIGYGFGLALAVALPLLGLDIGLVALAGRGLPCRGLSLALPWNELALPCVGLAVTLP